MLCVWDFPIPAGTARKYKRAQGKCIWKVFQAFQDSRCHKDIILAFTPILVHTCATVLEQTVEISGSLYPDQRFESGALE